MSIDELARYNVDYPTCIFRTFGKCIGRIDHVDLQLVWTENYYDGDISGTCIYNGQMAAFVVDFDTWHLDDRMMLIFELNGFQKLYWRFTQKKFELLYGYGMTNRSFKHGHH